MSSQIPGITATGNSQATAQPIASVGQIFTADVQVVPPGTGVVLPQFVQAPATGAIRNSGANTLLIYPLVGGTINGSSGAYGLTTGNIISINAFSPIDWVITPTGGGGSGSVGSGTGGQLAGYATTGTAVSGFSLGTNLSLSGTTLNAAAGGSGTVNAGTTGQLAVFPGNGTAVSGTSAPVIPTVVATYGATTTFDLSASNNHQVTLAGNSTLALSNATVGQRFTINLIQDGTGSRTVTWPAGFTWAGGSAPTLQTSPGAIDSVVVWCVSSGVYQGYPSSATAPGTSGQIPYNNAGILAGAANAKIDANSCFNIGSAIADPGTPTFGAIWPSSTSGGPKAAGLAGFGGVTRSLFSCESCTAVANLAVATSIFASPTNPQGSLTMQANSLKPGNMLRWQIYAAWGSAGASATLYFQYFLNGVVIFDQLNLATGALAQAAKPAYSQQPSFFRILTVGASATAGGFAGVALVNPGGSTLLTQSLPGGGTPVTTTTFASNASVLFDIKAVWSAASPSNTFQVLGFNLEIVQ